MEKIKFWFNNSRPYTIPITLLSWLVIFLFALKHGGNAINGILAYFGIAIVHLVTNLADDYFDYKRLCADERFLQSAKECKCKYLKEGNASIDELRNVIIIMLVIAGFLGAILFFNTGIYVLLFALAGLFIALSYSFMSSRGLGDIAVILAYGPLMYAGVYYVMTGDFSWDVILLSFASSMFVNSILYAHMLMDYDEDICSYKTTLCTKLGSKQKALNALMLFYAAGYMFMGILAAKTNGILYCLTFLTFPLVINLCKSLQIYNNDKTIVPTVKFYNYPLGDWNKIKNTPNASFFLRFLFARNISTWFMLLACFAILFS